MTTEATQEKTGLGNYFVANYPPFSSWKPLPARGAGRPRRAAGRRTRRSASTCTFRSAGNAASSATSASTPTRTPATSKPTSTPSSRKSNSTAKKPVVGGRRLKYVYFGGGTPSYLSAGQLRGLMQRLQAVLPWDGAEEVTFECEPGTLAAAQARSPARAGRDAPQPGRREFRPEDPRIQRPGASRRGDPPRLRLGARPRLRPDQHRPDRRHGRRDVGQLEDVRRQDAGPGPGQRHHLPDGTAVQHGLLAAAAGHRPGRAVPRRRRRRLADQAGLGRATPSTRWARPATRFPAPTRWSRTRRSANSSTATACGTAPTCSAPASPRSATSTASTSRTSIPGSSTSACSTRANCRWAGPCR